MRYGFEDLVACWTSVILRGCYSKGQTVMDQAYERRDVFSTKKQNLGWVIIDRPKGKKLVRCKWIPKRNDDMTEWPSRDTSQDWWPKEGIDFSEIYSLEVKHKSRKIIPALVAHFDMTLEQLDIKTSFLQGELEEEIFMNQPEGFSMDMKKSRYVSSKIFFMDWNKPPR